MGELFGTKFNVVSQSDPSAAIKLSRVIVADLKRDASLASSQQFTVEGLKIVDVSLSGCLTIEVVRKNVQRGTSGDGACLILDIIADQLNVFMLSKRVEVDVETGGFVIADYVKTTTTLPVVVVATTPAVSETTVQFVASADEVTMGAGTTALIAILVLVVVGT